MLFIAEIGWHLKPLFSRMCKVALHVIPLESAAATSEGGEDLRLRQQPTQHT